MPFISKNTLSKLRKLPIPDSDIQNPIDIVGNSIVFNPHEMEMNKYYLAELNGAPYLYRRVSSGEVEVYGLAD